MLDARAQESWVLEASRRALAVSGVELAAVAVASPQRDRRFASVAALLHSAVDRIDMQLRTRAERLFASVDVAGALGCPRELEMPVSDARDGWIPDERGVAALREVDADIWLCFAARAPSRSLPRVSRLGVWGLEIGLGVPATSIWAGASEIGGGSPVTAACVVDYADPERRAIYETVGVTVTNSARRNRLKAIRKATTFFRRLLTAVARDESCWTTARAATLALPANYPALREPTIVGVIRLCWRLFTSVLANRWRALRRRDQWRIGYYFTEGVEEQSFRSDRLRELVPPADRYWADPFALEHGGRHFIFFEELPYRTEKGRIMAVEVFEDGTSGVPEVALERPYHLSYPFVFSLGGELYMLPETAENRTVELYRCEEFPLRWTLHRVLLEDIEAFDATLWRQNDLWWLFATVAERGADASEELHVYWSPSPFGPWTAHRANPAISDARYARCAGPLFLSRGVLYRPSQDCSIAYGHAVSINRVDVLNPGRYRETPVRTIESDWRRDAVCVHTFGASSRLKVVDYLIRS